MKRALAAAVGLALTCGACTVSRVDPKADITIAGSVKRHNGAAVPDARLALSQEGDAGDVFLAFTTIGLACLAGESGPAICRDSRIATTGPNGGFTFRIKGKDTQSTFGYSSVLSISTALARKENESSGSSTTYRFHVQTEKLNLPIRFWEPSLTARTGTFGARVTFQRVPAGLLPKQLDRGGLDYTIAFSRGDEIVWQVEDSHPVTVFDPRLLEDSSGTMKVAASASSLHVSESLGDEVAYTLRSGGRPYESPMDPPTSRGHGCSVVDDHGKRYLVEPCPLTDGTFSEEFRPSVCSGQTSCTEPPHEAAFIDLGRQVSPSLVVVRGCPRVCRVETSVDARTWRLTGLAQTEQAAFPLTRSVAARYIRVSGSPNTTRIDGLKEISVWSGGPQVREGSLLVLPTVFEPAPTPTDQAAAREGRASSSDKGMNVWVLVATALLAGVAGAMTALFVRRRRPG